MAGSQEPAQATMSFGEYYGMQDEFDLLTGYGAFSGDPNDVGAHGSFNQPHGSPWQSFLVSPIMNNFTLQRPEQQIAWPMDNSFIPVDENTQAQVANPTALHLDSTTTATSTTNVAARDVNDIDESRPARRRKRAPKPLPRQFEEEYGHLLPLSIGTQNSAIPLKDIQVEVNRSARSRMEDVKPKKDGTKDVPRPRNSFVLYRTAFADRLKDICKGMHQDISKITGASWHKEPKDVQEQYMRWAEEDKACHARVFPGYKYKPTRRYKIEAEEEPDEGEPDDEYNPMSTYKRARTDASLAPTTVGTAQRVLRSHTSGRSAQTQATSKPSTTGRGRPRVTGRIIPSDDTPAPTRTPATGQSHSSGATLHPAYAAPQIPWPAMYTDSTYGTLQNSPYATGPYYQLPQPANMGPAQQQIPYNFNFITPRNRNVASYTTPIGNQTSMQSASTSGGMNTRYISPNTPFGLFQDAYPAHAPRTPRPQVLFPESHVGHLGEAFVPGPPLAMPLMYSDPMLGNYLDPALEGEGFQQEDGVHRNGGN